MTENFSKREFVDKYPYIVYTGENDTSSDDLKVKSGSITSDDLANGAVTTGKIADGAVTSGKIAEGAIPTASADTLGGVKIGEGLSITEAGVLSASGGGAEFEIINVQDDFTQGKHILLTPIEDVLAMWRDTRPVIMVQITAIYSESTHTEFMALAPYSATPSTNAIGSYNFNNTEYYVNMDGTITTTV